MFENIPVKIVVTVAAYDIIPKPINRSFNLLQVSMKGIQRILNFVGGEVCIQAREIWESFLLHFHEIRTGMWLSSPSIFHGINEICRLVISKVLEDSHVEGSHHIVIFVYKVMTVEHVDTVPWGEFSYDANFLIGAEDNNIFEPSFVWHHLVPSAASRDDLEIDEMNVNRYILSVFSRYMNRHKEYTYDENILRCCFQVPRFQLNLSVTLQEFGS